MQAERAAQLGNAPHSKPCTSALLSVFFSQPFHSTAIPCPLTFPITSNRSIPDQERKKTTIPTLKSVVCGGLHRDLCRGPLGPEGRNSLPHLCS